MSSKTRYVVNDRVMAVSKIMELIDQASAPQLEHVHAEPGELGTVVHVGAVDAGRSGPNTGRENTETNMSIAEVKRFVESWIADAKKDSVAVIDKPIQICGVTLPKDVVDILKAHYFVECEERANQILQMLEDVDQTPAREPTTRAFDSAYLTDKLELPHSAEFEEIIGLSRWTVQKNCFFRTDDLPDGYYWKAAYSKGATERQDEQPWEHVDEVKCTLVRRGAKIVEAWIPAVMPDVETNS